MKKKTLNSIIAAGAMVVLSIGVIASAKILTGKKTVKTESIDVASYTSSVENTTVVSAGKITDGDGGYLVQVSSVGFNAQEPIVMNITFDATGAKVEGLEIESQNETAGIGANITGEDFLNQFAGADMAAPVYTADMEQNGTAFDQVSGASFSSKAVANGINVANDFLNTVQK